MSEARCYRPAGSGQIVRCMRAERVRYQARSPRIDGRNDRRDYLGTFDTVREAEAAIALWKKVNS